MVLDIEAPIYYDKKHEKFAPRQDFIHGDYDDAFIAPLENTPPLIVDRQIKMTLNFVENTDGLNHGIMNDIPYIPPYVPTLHTVMTVGEQYERNLVVYGPQTNAYLFDMDQVIELVINNSDDGPHPCKFIWCMFTRNLRAF
jgi:iron transport multicopper oxidase